MLDLSIFSKIEDNLYFLPSEDSPILSADIGLFVGGKFVWTYDCGASDRAYELLKSIDNLNITFSHFHKDHTENIYRLTNVSNNYVGNYSYKHFGFGTVITDDIYFEDEGIIHIFPLSNSHSKGSLAMEINDTYVFIGDSAYGKWVDKHLTYNAQLLLEQYRKLKTVNAEKCLVSHDKQFVIDKSEILAKFEKILSKRKSSEPIIVL